QAQRRQQQHALQGVPRQDRGGLQRHQERGGGDHVQEGGQPVHGETHQRAHRTRVALAIARRVCPPGQGERGEEAQGQGRGHAHPPQTPAGHAPRRAHGQHEGQPARDDHADPVRNDHL
ncbi:hypothetical protein GP486_008818, partial [Trichoglossum hirsutum]